MTGTLPAAGELGFDTFGTACGLAVIAGALAVVVPTLALLAPTLVALALAGWAVRHRQGDRRRARSSAARAGAVGAWLLLAGGTAAYLDPLGPWRAGRALLLGLGVVPLWVLERREPGPGRSRGRRA
jgi:hypothetical protein